ncbi:hypothetical protein M0804_004014 [Polistes exclamans]|nr:hypothetical protein M0804_004014 [Polistes exclamans]
MAKSIYELPTDFVVLERPFSSLCSLPLSMLNERRNKLFSLPSFPLRRLPAEAAAAAALHSLFSGPHHRAREHRQDKAGMLPYLFIRIVKSKQWRYLDSMSSVWMIMEHRATNSKIQYYKPGNSKLPPSASTTQ